MASRGEPSASCGYVPSVGGERSRLLGLFGEEWVATIAAAAGCSATPPRKDDGIDLIVDNPTANRLNLQIKTTEVKTPSNGAYTADLKTKNVQYLLNSSSPSFVVLVVVHRRKWTGHTGPGSIVRATCYWADPKEFEAIDGKLTGRLSLPICNMLTPDTLVELFEEGGASHG